MLITLHKNQGIILLLPLTDTFKSSMLWINTSALILLLMLRSVLWLLEMRIGKPDGMLTRLCLRTIPLHSLSVHVLAWPSFLLLIAPSFALGVFNSSFFNQLSSLLSLAIELIYIYIYNTCLMSENLIFCSPELNLSLKASYHLLLCPQLSLTA